MTKSISRREFIIKGRDGLTAYAMYAGLYWFLNKFCADKAYADSTKETLSLEEIERLLKRGTVENILREEYKAGLIKRVRYDRRKHKTNFKELVYQEHLSPECKKPALVFFYCTPIDNVLADEREAIILKEIAKAYKGKIKIFTYEVSIEPTFTGRIENGIFGTEVRSEEIKGMPSLAIYSKFDLLKGETLDNNNGRIKKIDILQGGPVKNVENIWLEFIRDKWIPTNITSPNKIYAWRFNNTSDERKVTYKS